MTKKPLSCFLASLLTALSLACAAPPPTDPTMPIAESAFAKTVQAAAGSTVRFYGWGGSDTINKWLDTTVKAALDQQYHLKWERVASDAPAALAKLRAELAAGKTVGTIDLLWINGENFKTAQSEGLLWGPIDDSLPNFRHFVDPATTAWDFGTATNGLESPWGRAEFVFEYDQSRVSDPPHDAAGLLAWIKAHPGRFTYPEPPDFTGSAFIRQLFVQLNGGPQAFLGTFSEQAYQAAAAKLWTWLRQAAPALWQGGRTYPRSSAELDLLFERAEVDWSMSYTPSRAQGKIQDGRYPATVRTLVLAEGSLSNIHFVAIPFNAPNKVGALALANLLLSPELQYDKNRPVQWGDFSVLDPAKLAAADRQRFAQLDLGVATLPTAVLAQAAIPEIPPVYVERLEQDWLTQIAGQRP